MTNAATQARTPDRLATDLAPKPAITKIAAESEPVAQVFVDDSGRRQAAVRLVMTVAKLAVVTYSIFLMFGVARVLFGEAIDFVRPPATDAATSESTETSETIVWGEVDGAAPSPPEQSRLALVAGATPADMHETSMTETDEQPTAADVAPTTGPQVGRVVPADNNGSASIDDSANNPTAAEPIAPETEATTGPVVEQADDRSGEPGLSTPGDTPSVPTPVDQGESANPAEPVVEPGIALPDPTEPTTDEPAENEQPTDDRLDDDPTDDDPTTDDPTTDEPTADEPGNDNPGNDNRGNNDPGSNRPRNDKPRNNRPGQDEADETTADPAAGEAASTGDSTAP